MMYCRYCGKTLTTADNLDRCYPSCTESLERKTGLMITLQPYDYVALVKERDALRAENEKLKEALRELEEEKQAGWVEWLEGVNMAMFKEMQERIAELEQERGKVHNFIMSIKRWLYKNKGMPEPLWSDDIDEILALFESQSPSEEE